MKITAKRLKEMQKMLLELETDLWEDSKETEAKTKVPEEYRQIYQNACVSLMRAWGALDDLIPPWLQ